MTPYPGTGLYQRIESEGRLLHNDWDRYDTRHAVFQPALMTPSQLEEGYWWAYEEFYKWRSIARAASTKPTTVAKARHVAYSAGWKKFEPLWDLIVRAKRMPAMLPVLEAVLSGLDRIRPGPGVESPALVAAETPVDIAL